MDFDKILEHLGRFGRYQQFIYVLACITQIFVGIHMLADVFQMADLKHRCVVPVCDTTKTQYNEPFLEFTTPHAIDGPGYDPCRQYKYKNTGVCKKESFTNETIECGALGWIYDHSEFQSTTVSSFNLVCKKSWIKTESQSVFMGGVLLGAATFGLISDKFGRKAVFMISTVIFLASSVCTAFSPNSGMYTCLRFLTAASVSGLFQTAFIIAIEFVGTSKRVLCANFMQVVFAIGELLLGLTAYFIHDWKKLQLAISVPAVILLSYYWFMPESVRWLISKGKYHQAKCIVLKAAERNKVNIPDHLLRPPETISYAGNAVVMPRNHGPLDILKNKTLRKWSLNLFFNWIVNAMVYYGLSLSAASLSSNVLVSFVCLAAVEIPADLLAVWALKYFGRRCVLCIVMVFGGSMCIITPFIPKAYPVLATALAVIGKSAIAASFAIIYVYSAEIFPTTVRSTGIGMSSMFARFGGIAAPVIHELRKFYRPLPMLVFGVSSVLAGILALFLPETFQKHLPETLEEAEDLADNASGTTPFGPGGRHRRPWNILGRSYQHPENELLLAG